MAIISNCVLVFDVAYYSQGHTTSHQPAPTPFNTNYSQPFSLVKITYDTYDKANIF